MVVHHLPVALVARQGAVRVGVLSKGALGSRPRDHLQDGIAADVLVRAA